MNPRKARCLDLTGRLRELDALQPVPVPYHFALKMGASWASETLASYYITA